MAKASDNAFPSILIVESTAPATPASGDQRVYIDSTSHHLTRKNASGTVVDIETAAGGVTSAIGTSNQVAVSASTGAVTFSTPQDIATTSSVTFKSAAMGGLTGATAASRYVGGLATGGTPGSGTFLTGDWLIGQDGTVWVCTSGGTPGTWAKSGGGGDLTKISNQTSGSAVASLSWTSIASTYKTLKLIGWVRANDATTPRYLEMQFNGDSASNYQYQWVYNNANSTAAGNPGSGASAIILGQVVDGNGTASYVSSVEITIPNYASTNFMKSAHGLVSDTPTSGGTGYIVTAFGGMWRSTTAINRVDLLMNTGNLGANVEFTLYGMN